MLLVSVMDTLDDENAPALLEITNSQIKSAIAAKKAHIPILKIKVVGGPAYGKYFVRNPLDASR